jgi:hypothetical protein
MIPELLRKVGAISCPEMQALRKYLWPGVAQAAIALFAGLPICPVAGAEPAKPADLKAEIIVNRDTYELTPATSGDDFVKRATDRKRRGPLPPPPKVDLILRLSNSGNADRTLTIGGDESHLLLHLEGTGALNLNPGMATTMEFRMGKPVVLKAGAQHDIAIKSLASGPRNIGQYSYWTQAGEYRLKASFTCRESKKQLKLETESVKLKVVEPAQDKK